MNPERLEALLTQADQALKKLRDDQAAATLVNRNTRGGGATAVAIDGYPTTSMSPGRGSGETTATEAAALATYHLTCDAPDCGRTIPCAEHGADIDTGANGHWLNQRADPVQAVVDQLDGNLTAAVASLWACVRNVKHGHRLAQPGSRHSNDPTYCLACGRRVECTADDPIRSGHCNACDVAWRRYRDNETTAGRTPDVVLYRLQRPNADTDHAGATR